MRENDNPTSESRGAQEGVAGLLAGQAQTIAPEGWRAVHRREPSKVDVRYGEEGGPAERRLDVPREAPVVVAPVGALRGRSDSPSSGEG